MSWLTSRNALFDVVDGCGEARFFLSERFGSPGRQFCGGAAQGIFVSER
jgi:hypothetical protein